MRFGKKQDPFGSPGEMIAQETQTVQDLLLTSDEQ